MYIQNIFYSITCLMLLLSSCTSDEAQIEQAHLGGCILLSPVSEAPMDLYQESKIIPTDKYPPFTKKLTVYGLTLIGRDDISDDFMREVAKTVKQMFPQGEGIDSNLQEELIRNMYRYNAVIPFYKGTDHEMTRADKEAWDLTRSQNSVCDIIMEGVPGQTTEVVEHILHYVSSIGLHYTFPDEWGVSKTSKIYYAKQTAVQNKYYDVEQYGDIEEDEVRNRVIIQELAYWVIYTAWDLREPYGPKESEFKITNSTDLKTKLPDLYQVYAETIPKVMTVPDRTTLDGFEQQYSSKTN